MSTTTDEFNVQRDRHTIIDTNNPRGFTTPMPDAIPRWKPRCTRARRMKETAHYQSARWDTTRDQVLVRDAFTCRTCRMVVHGKNAHVDHIIPLEDGGTDDAANLQTLCASCHGRKTLEEQRRRGFF